MTTTTTAPAPHTTCDPGTATTRTLLGYGLLAGPLYVGVSLAQALGRDGFDLGRHGWSLLSNGSLGWIQILNFVLSGLCTVAFAAGLRRALRGGPGATWAPRLLGAYGVSLVGAGVFRADPAAGFPLGTPAGVPVVSWHGVLHFAVAVAGIGFGCLVAAGRPRRAAFDRAAALSGNAREQGLFRARAAACGPPS